MMHTARLKVLWATVAIAVSATASAQQYTVEWYTIDGGGAMFTTGGGFELSGTIGQSDATTLPMTGGGFALVGGYWAGTSTGSQFAHGDMNCDGSVDGADIDPFFLAIGDPFAYAQQFPECDFQNADMNTDGFVDGADIDPFFDCLGGGSCP